MANCSVNYPRVEDLLLKIGNFVFPIDFVVIDMKEDEDVTIILGRSLLNTARALVDVRESNLTLRVGKEEMTFGVEAGFTRSKNQNEVFLRMKIMNLKN